MIPRPTARRLTPPLLAGALVAAAALTSCGGTDTTFPATKCCVQGVQYYVCGSAVALALCTSSPPDPSQCTLQVNTPCP